MFLSKNEVKFIIIVSILAGIFYVLFFPGNSFYPDQEQYLTLGNDIINGKFSLGVLHRGAVLPFLTSLSLLMLGVNATIFVLPLVLTILLIVTSFVFAKKMIGSGYIATIILLTLPYFWRWTVRLLVETTLTILILISIMLFFDIVEGKEKDKNIKKPFLLGISAALSFLTKFTGILLFPVFFVYLLFRKKLSVLKEGRILFSIFIFALVSVSISLIIFVLSGTFGIEHLFVFSNVSANNVLYYFTRFAIIPWSLFFIIGFIPMIKRKSKENVMLLSMFFVIFLVFQLANFKEDRFLFAIFPVYACIATLGFNWLKKYFKLCAKCVFVLFAVIGILLSAWMLVFDSNHHLDRIPAGDFVSNLPKDAIIASEVSVGYLSLFHPNVIYFPADDIETRKINQFVEGWAKSNNADYIIITIYGEFNRHPNYYDYYPDFFFGLKLPIKHEYRSNRIPPDTKFKSAVYTQLETWDSFEKIYENYQNEQKIFIVYKVNKE
ncbi:MAG: glycosyltransferase family 39 protein [Nanoarchaeota archaeon]